MKVKMKADGTEVNHSKRDINDQNKETKERTADGGSKDGGRERSRWGQQVVNRTQATTRTRSDESTPR